MAQRTFNQEGRTRALNALVPPATQSYSPIPHRFFLNELPNLINSDPELEVVNTRMYTNMQGTKLVGFTTVKNRNDRDVPEFGLHMMLGWKNSYDKSIAAALAAGASVIMCSNGVIYGDMLTFKRKHTGTVMDEIRGKSVQAVEAMKDGFMALTLEIDVMRNYDLTQRDKAEILGVMYFEENLVSPNQLSVIKKELTDSEHFTGNSLWDLYNNVTESLKRSHPSTHIEDHIKLHKFMTGVAGITQQNDDIIVEDEPVPNDTQG